jgi:hypothetical protein
MEHYLTVASQMAGEFTRWTPPQMVLYTMLGMGALSAWVVARFAAAPPMFSGPISFIVLTFAAAVSNFLGRSVIMLGTSEVQKAMMFTVIGHALFAVLLLAIFKVGEGRGNR